MRIALADLGLHRIFVVYPGKKSYALDDTIRLLSILDLPAQLAALG